MTKHLRTPLTRDGADIIDAAGKRIFDADHAFDFSATESECHAEELIVRANLHDELVAALKDAHAYMPLGAQRARIGDVIAKVEAR